MKDEKIEFYVLAYFFDFPVSKHSSKFLSHVIDFQNFLAKLSLYGNVVSFVRFEADAYSDEVGFDGLD